jgi:malate dehydrogenase (oxaloacetate-decarboxylating)(NADP+)
VDSRGLVVKDRPNLAEHKRAYAHEYAPIADFQATIRALKPTAIIGVSAMGGAFTREVLQAMAQLNQRPIVFALSNPTSKSECTAEDAYRYTDGRALFACGSPYPPVKLNGTVLVPRQGNNSYIFPGVGLGAIASGARRITDEMFMSAALTLAQLVNDSDLEQGSLYPALPRIREVSARIAAEVGQVAYKRGLTAGEVPDDVLMHVTSHIYEPRYCSYA